MLSCTSAWKNSIRGRPTRPFWCRNSSLAAWDGSLHVDCFDWVREPVLNPYTRVAVAMSAATGTLRIVGYDRTADAPLPEPVTQVCAVETEMQAA